MKIDSIEVLSKRVLEISYNHRLSHISSCLTALPILRHMYDHGDYDDKIVLSSGHAGLSQYVCLESVYGRETHDAEKMLADWGIHPERDLSRHVDVSAGSLGCGILVAAGMALANPKNTVYCLVSDGELAEGSCWEAFTFIHDQKIKNIDIHVNVNGYSAYSNIDREYVANRVRSFLCNAEIWHQNIYHKYPFLNGIGGHYKVMTKEEYESALNA